MSIESNSHSSQSRGQQPASEDKWQPDEYESLTSTGQLPSGLTAQQVNSAIASVQSQQKHGCPTARPVPHFLMRIPQKLQVTPQALLITLLLTLITIVGIAINQPIVGIVGTVLTLILSVIILFPWLRTVVTKMLTPEQRALIVAFFGITVAIAGLVKFVPAPNRLGCFGNFSRLVWCFRTNSYSHYCGLCCLATVCHLQRFNNSAKFTHNSAE